MKVDIFNTKTKYGIVHTDPPWEQTKGNKRKCRPNQGKGLDHQTLNMAEIKKIHKQIASLCEEKHNIFMWAIDKYLHETEQTT